MIQTLKTTTLICLVLLLASFSPLGKNDAILGKWKTIDDETGEAKSIVELYEKNGLVYGKVVELLKEKDQNKLCTECKGSKKNQKMRMGKQNHQKNRPAQKKAMVKREVPRHGYKICALNVLLLPPQAETPTST